MQYSDNFAYMENNAVVILQPQKPPLSFSYDIDKNLLSPSNNNSELAEKTLAHGLWGSLAYENEWYSQP